jgi:hypothetical protein
VTAVVAVISIFSKKIAICGTLNLGMRSLLANRQEVPIPHRKIPVDQETFLRKQEKAGNLGN